jgi:cytochrome c oxidase cbb3-type subunit 3
VTRIFSAVALLWAVAFSQQNPGTFPAMQRPKADPEVVARGKAVFGVQCVACHGADARGGALNGPNLLRSQLVLADKDGELIDPVIRNGRPERGMPALPLSDDDIKAIVEFIHSLTAASPGQGMPPRAEAPPPDIVVGDAAAGRTYFAAQCSACHSAEGDLQGIATRIDSPKALQNVWVSGGAAGFRRGRGGRGGGRGGGGEGSDDGQRAPVTATVTLSSGERVQGRLAFIDDYGIKLIVEDGSVRSLARNGDVPRVEIVDPLARHKELLSILTDQDMRNVTAYLVTLK